MPHNRSNKAISIVLTIMGCSFASLPRELKEKSLLCNEFLLVFLFVVLLSGRLEDRMSSIYHSFSR